jgi:hypothetical protein
LLVTLCPAAQSQTIADKTVATVTNGARANPDLITYSDIVWQLALEPNRPFNEHPSSQDLNQALKTLEDQLLILQEARKLPLAEKAEAQVEFEATVKQRRDELAQQFGVRALAERMARVGLTSEQLNAILRDRVTIELADRLAQGPALAYGSTKVLLTREQDMDLGGAIELEAQTQALLMKTEDHAEFYAAFTEGRQPSWKGR